MLMALTLVACGYEPPVDTAVEYPDAIALSGDVVLADAPAEPGPAMVLLYEATNPPLPSGFGRPLDFATVTRWGGDTAGLRSGAWALNGVQPGDYLLTTLVDHDRDFNPFWDFMGSATCGDQLGAWVEGLSSTSPAVLRLGETDLGRHITDLPIAALSPLTLERPAFSVAALSAWDLTAPQDPPQTVVALGRTPAATTLQLITLQSLALDHPLLTLNPPDAADCPTAFPLTLADLDGDGVSDLSSLPEAAALGLAEVAWPQVYLVLVADAEGNPPEAGHRWITQPLVYMPLNTAIPPGVPQLVDSLTLVFVPQGLHIYTDMAGNEQRVPFSGEGFPAGVWATVVVNPTGQSWVVPNQLGGDDGELSAAGFEVEPSQSASASVFVQ